MTSNMAKSLPEEKNLAETLTRLEAALLSPPIAGELQMWTKTVQEAAATLAVDLASYLRTVLHVQYEEIAKTDPEMSAHVEKLVRSDQQLLEQLTKFHEELHALGEAAQHVSKNEGKLAQQRQKLEETGTALILAIKRQQATATTGLAEAHFRDRGVAG
jgi:vacuolar-type H+-ATPase subunit I/STV1